VFVPSSELAPPAPSTASESKGARDKLACRCIHLYPGTKGGGGGNTRFRWRGRGGANSEHWREIPALCRYSLCLALSNLPLHGFVSSSTLLLHCLQAAHPIESLQPLPIQLTSPWRCVLLHSSAPWPPGCPSHGTSSVSPHPNM
jgi:hypothetical protein